METIYDWLTMLIFAGLIVLFLQRSQGEHRDSMWHYLVAAVGCAGSNWLGNEGHDLIAVVAIIGTLAFIQYFLRPLDDFKR